MLASPADSRVPPEVRVEHGGSAAEQAHRGRMQFEFIQNRSSVAGNPQCIANQIGLHIVEPCDVETNAANARENARGWFGIVRIGDERAMHRHCLGGEFNAAGDTKTAVRTQRVIGRAVTAAAAGDCFGTPIDDLVEQTHAALVRDVRFYPGAIQLHGSISTMIFDPSRYSRTARPSPCVASCRNKGRQRAAGIEARSDSSCASGSGSQGPSPRDASMRANDPASRCGVSTNAAPKASGIGRLERMGSGYSASYAISKSDSPSTAT